MKKMFQGLIDLKPEIEANKKFYPGFARDPKAMTNLSMAGTDIPSELAQQVK